MAGWDKFLQSGTLPNFILGYNVAGGIKFFVTIPLAFFGLFLCWVCFIAFAFS